MNGNSYDKVRFLYRARQFWHALTSRPAPEDLQRARRVLSPQLMTLFLRMQPDEQAHSLWIFSQMLNQNETSEDLLAAALLHDAGKSRHPLRPWGRVLIVLGKHIFPLKVKSWGRGAARGWRRPFVVAEQHAEWGAEMAEEAGASPVVVELIRRHQDSLNEAAKQPKGDGIGGAAIDFARLEDELLFRLQSLDNES